MRRAAGVMASVGVHLFVLAALIGLRSAPPPVETPPIEVTLVKLPKPPKPPAPVEAPKPSPAPPKAARSQQPNKTASATQQTAIRTPAPRKVAASAPSVLAEAANPGPPELSEADLAGAASAGGGDGSGAGAGGGACDMIRRVQAALRKDTLVRTEVAAASHSTRALLVWNGDWVQGRGEDGRGLAAVREAIIWEVGFAPKACRTEPVRGLVLFTLGEAPGAPRLVVGQNEWRWSDMLTAKGMER